MFTDLKKLQSTLKNYKDGELNISNDIIVSIVCPKYFNKEEFIELFE